MSKSNTIKTVEIVKKILFSSILIGISCNAFAYKVTVANTTPTELKTHGPLIVLRSFFPTKGLGNIHYLTNPTPASYHQMSKSVFSAFSAFHTNAPELGNALISPGVITVGNLEVDKNKTNFVISLAERDGKDQIGPIKCSADKSEQCYEFPHTTVKVVVNGKAYPDLIDQGQILLPKGDFYQVNLAVSVAVIQTEVSIADKNPRKKSSVPVTTIEKTLPNLYKS